MKLRDVETGEEVRTFTGHTGEINSVSFSSDGRKIASGSVDLNRRITKKTRMIRFISSLRCFLSRWEEIRKWHS